MLSPAPLLDEELQYFRELIRELAGITLPPAKNHLIESRLLARLSANNMTSYGEYRRWLEGLPSGHPEWQLFINILTTNKTDFFREPAHFDFLINTTLPAWLKHEKKTFRVWSCASSTGEEPFTLAMILSKYLPSDRSFEILATDIDTAVLSTAQNSVYPVEKLHEIPSDFHSYLDIGTREANGWFRIAPEVRSKVQYQIHNLVDESIPADAPFDLILCRNVMIYFSRDTVERVAQKLGTAAHPQTTLFIGHSESLQGMKTPWKIVRPSIFSLKR